MKDVTAVIVTHNSVSSVGAAIESCLRAGADVIVIDNASSDGTAAEVRKHRGAVLVANVENRGFAGAVNQGFALSRRPFVLLLNPDAAIECGLEELAAACGEAGVGAACGRLLDASGDFQSGFAIRRLPTAPALAFEALGINRAWPANPVNRRYRCVDFDPERPCDVEQPAGAFLLVGKKAWEQIGGFDERFHPVWFEDVDFARRLLGAGLRIRYEPRAKARHQGGHSVNKLDWERRELYWYSSLLGYAGKHFPSGRARLVALAVMGGALLRMVTGIWLRRDKPFRVYGKVIRLAWRHLFIPGGSGWRNGSGKRFIDQAHIHVV